MDKYQNELRILIIYYKHLGSIIMNKKYIFIVLSVVQITLFGLSSKTVTLNKITAEEYAYFAKTTCQCQNCELPGIDLSYFRPGAVVATRNTLYRNNPFSTLLHNHNKINVIPWLNCNFSNANIRKEECYY